jgi:hypothetical protein
MPLATPQPAGVKILIAGPDLRPVLPPVTDWKSIDCTDKCNQPGSGSFTAPARQDLIDAVQAEGNRVHLYLDGVPWMCGPIEEPGKLDVSSTGDTAGGVLTVSWASYTAALGWRLCYPDPAHGTGGQTAVQYTATGSPETLMRTLVDVNAGPSALADRRIQSLVLGDLAGISHPDVSVVTRFDPLTDKLRDIAGAGGDLTFEVLLRDNPSTGLPELAFMVYQPRDLSAVVVFSTGAGNLRSVSTSPATPTATAAIVGFSAAGTSPDTTLVERVNTAAIGWGRIEKWVASTATDSSLTAGQKTQQMQQDGDLALLAGAPSTGLTADVIDNGQVRYRDRFRLGDLVGIRPVLGVLLADEVTAVRLSGTPKDGVTEVPTIGDGSPSVAMQRIRVIRDLERRLGRRERS